MSLKIVSPGGLPASTTAMETAIADVETAVAAVETAVAAVETDVVAVKTSVDAQALDYTEIKQISCGYGSNYTYTVYAGACVVYWITLWHQYNTKQWSYLRNNTTTIWYFSHMPTQYKPYHLKFDPPLVFADSCTINMAAMGRAMICYKAT